MRPRRSSLVLGSLLAVLLVVAFAPTAAKACSCVPPDMIIDSLGAPDDQSVVFSGRVGPAAGNQVPIEVTGWFGGPPPAGIVIVEVAPGDGASCGTTAPPAGRQLLFVSYEVGNGSYGMSLCSVAADLATPDGQATLQAVTAKLGPPFAVAQAPPTSDPELEPTAISATAELAAVALPVGGALLVAVLVVGGLFFVVGRRQRG
jgi:hypothetical protein